MKPQRPIRQPELGKKPTFSASPPRKLLTPRVVEMAFKNDNRFPPLFSLKQAAELAHYAPSTLKRLVSEGFFRNGVRRGRPIAFWRGRFAVEVMELDRTIRYRRRRASPVEDNENETDRQTGRRSRQSDDLYRKVNVHG